MTAEYVRNRYNVPYKVGDRLIADGGRPGKLVSFPGQYLGIRFDGEKFTTRVHPTENVHRPGEPIPTDCYVCGALAAGTHIWCLRRSLTEAKPGEKVVDWSGEVITA